MHNNDSPNAVEITGLTKTYASGLTAIKNMNLSIREGEFFALLGANGAGKTTTIKILTDLARKTEGSVKIFGIDIDKDFVAAKQLIGIVPQEFNFDNWAKVIDVVTTQAGYYGIPLSESLPKAKQVLQDLGLGDKLNTQAFALSGGMKRRLMIARSMIHKPKLLILDEPTAGVDVELRHGMWEYLTKANKEDGMTILLTTHYLEEVEQLCNRAAIIKQGEIIKLDTVKNLISSLDSEDYVVDINEKADLQRILQNQNQFQTTTVDDNTFEVSIKKGDGINNLINFLSEHHIEVNGIRPKGNRLETLFLKILQD